MRLSPRESETALLLLAGLPQKEIAARLRLSTKTVATYLASIKRKTGTTGTVGMVLYFVRHGLAGWSFDAQQ